MKTRNLFFAVVLVLFLTVAFAGSAAAAGPAKAPPLTATFPTTPFIQINNMGVPTYYYSEGVWNITWARNAKAKNIITGFRLYDSTTGGYVGGVWGFGANAYYSIPKGATFYAGPLTIEAYLSGPPNCTIKPSVKLLDAQGSALAEYISPSNGIMSGVGCTHTP